MESVGVAVGEKKAQELLCFLSSEGLLNNSLKPKKQGGKVVFPVRGDMNRFGGVLSEKFSGVEIGVFDFDERSFRPRSLKDALKGVLNDFELAFCPSSFDLVGDCAILELDERIKSKAKVIGRALLDFNPSVRTVYLKVGAHQGVFREEPVEFVCGEKKDFAIYKEHGCVFRVSIGKVFFTPRLSTERKRIASLIKPGERVACLFAGVGPFPIVFARNSGMSEAVAIELNPVAFEDLKENIKLNKVEDKVKPFLGDVKDFSFKKDFFGKFDRVVMPLPKGGENFLDDALRFVKSEGGVVHYYQFVSVDGLFVVPRSQIAGACAKANKKFEIVGEKKVRDYSPDMVQVVVDFRVWSI